MRVMFIALYILFASANFVFADGKGRPKENPLLPVVVGVWSDKKAKLEHDRLESAEKELHRESKKRWAEILELSKKEIDTIDPDKYASLIGKQIRLMKEDQEASKKLLESLKKRQKLQSLYYKEPAK